MSKKYVGKNVSVEWKFDLSKTLRENFSNRQWAKLSEEVVKNMILEKIDKGLSPVNGERMFQKYKDPKRYPGNKKSSNKPNLRLSGDMLGTYTTKAGNENMSISFGIFDSEQKIKAKANNEGTQGAKSALSNKIARNSRDRKLQRVAKSIAKGIPSRPFIPLKGQNFTRDIVLEIRKLFAYCLNQAINRGKNK